MRRQIKLKLLKIEAQPKKREEKESMSESIHKQRGNTFQFVAAAAVFRKAAQWYSLTFRSMNLFSGLYHCMRNIPLGVTPHRYL